MAIKIGHASIDERGKTSGGTAGDQTGKEVCIRTWYSKPWGLVLRPKSASVAERMARACEAACANNKIGYDQGQRNTLNAQAKTVGYDLSRVGKCECDCSSLMAVCAQAAGVNIPYTSGNAPTTRTMRTAFSGTGAFEVLTESKYLTTDAWLKRGDVLVAPGAHTVMALESGGSVAATTSKEVCNVTLRVLRKGATGEDVRALQRLLITAGYSCGKYADDGDFGSGTESAVRSYQQAHSLTADGIVGTNTWTKLLGV